MSQEVEGGTAMLAMSIFRRCGQGVALRSLSFVLMLIVMVVQMHLLTMLTAITMAAEGAMPLSQEQPSEEERHAGHG